MQQRKLALTIIAVATLSRLIPHPANFTPSVNLALFSGRQLSRKTAILITLVSLLLSDIALAAIYGYPIFGYWTLFSYSAFAVIAICGQRLSQNSTDKLLSYVLISTLGYWLWTNFGAWLLTPTYTKDLAGLTACYTAALPFLRNALYGDLIWMVLIFGDYKHLAKLAFFRQMSTASATNNNHTDC